MLYQLNTFMRLFGFLSRGIVFLAVGFILGILYDQGKVHFPSLSLVPVAKAATIDPYLRTPDGSPINEGIVSIDYSATDFAVGTTYYKFTVSYSKSPYQYSSSCTSIGAGTVTGNIEIPASAGEYSAEMIREYQDSSCTITNGVTAYDDPFTVISSDVATTTEATTTPPLSSKDSLFLWGVVIFLLSYPVWVRIFNV